MKNFISSLFTASLMVQFSITFSQISSPTVQKAEIIVSGRVLDSTSRQPLPYVALQIKNKPSGRSTADDGGFSISCSAGDTVIFTRLGYYPCLFIVTRAEDFRTIEMIENAKMLNTITVYDRIIIPGMTEWKKGIKPSGPIKFENKAQNAAIGSLPTFGPGVVIGFGGNGKMKGTRDDLARTELYRSTVNDPAVKKQLMDLYGITAETYYRKLEAFNKENKEAAYLTKRDEIISMLIQFFALKDR